MSEQEQRDAQRQLLTQFLAETIPQIDGQRTPYVHKNMFHEWDIDVHNLTVDDHAMIEGVEGYFPHFSFSTNERKTEFATHANSVWVDIDAGPNKPYPTPVVAWGALVNFVNQHNIPHPTWAVQTGNGVHAFWALGTTLDAELWVVLATLLRTACQVANVEIDGPITTDAARIMRAPTGRTKATAMNPGTVKFGRISQPTTPSDLYHALDAVCKAAGVSATPVTKATKAAQVEPYSALTLIELADGNTCAHVDAWVQGAGSHSEAYWRHGLIFIEGGQDSLADKQYMMGKISAIDPQGGDDDHEWAVIESKVAAWRQSGSAPARKEVLNNDAPPEVASKCRACRLYDTCQKPSAVAVVNVVPLPLVEMPKAAPIEPGSVVSIEGNVVVAVGEEACYPNGMFMEALKTTVFFSEPGLPHDPLKPGMWIHREGAKSVPAIEERLADARIMIVDTAVGAEHTRSWRFRCDVVSGQVPQVKFVDISHFDLAKVGDPLLKFTGAGITCLGDTTMFMGAIRHMTSTANQTMEPTMEVTRCGWIPAPNKGEDGSFAYGGDIFYPKAGKKRGMLIIDSTNTTLKAVGQTSGTIQSWVHGLLSIIPPNNPDFIARQFLFATGFGGPIHSMGAGEIGGVIMAHSEGSGTGKSATLKLAASIWGNPTGYVINPKSTSKSHTMLMGSLHSLPAVFEEVTVMDPESFNDLIYASTLGVGMSRLSNNGSAGRKPDEWRSFATMSANVHPKDKLTGYTANAKLARVLPVELSKIRYEEGVDVEQFLSQNYGTAGEVFISHVVNSQSEINDIVVQHSNALHALLKGNVDHMSMARFWISMAASVLAGAEVARDLGLYPFNIDALRAYCVLLIAGDGGANTVVESAATGAYSKVLGMLIAPSDRTRLVRVVDGVPENSGVDMLGVGMSIAYHSPADATLWVGKEHARTLMRGDTSTRLVGMRGVTQVKGAEIPWVSNDNRSVVYYKIQGE